MSWGMAALSLVLSVLLFFHVTKADEHCWDEFPISESISTLLEIVSKFGTTKKTIDCDATVWLNILIDRKEVKINDRIYYLNSPQPASNTFYFVIEELMDIPVFVVPDALKETWNPVFPDRTYLLSKISFQCGDQEEVCGLKCCPKENRKVQEAFIDANGALRDTVNLGNISYSLKHENNETCSYRLSYYDNLYKKVQGGTIYFSCPDDIDCCGLSCKPMHIIETAELQVQQENEKVYSRNLIWYSFCSLGLSAIIVLNAVFCYLRRNNNNNEGYTIVSKSSSVDDKEPPV